MKSKNKTNGQAGFTLIETLMAMAIFTIGILGLFGMQTAAIKENMAANAITTGSTWAIDRVEQLLAMDYSDAGLNKTVDTCADLPESFTDTGWVDPPEEYGTGTIYTVYWAVAHDCLLTDISDNSDPDQEQKPKYLRIIVTRDPGTGEEEVAVFNYIIQNIQD